MTLELKHGCEQAMEDAIASGDQQQIWRANARFQTAIMECQYKTGKRVKFLIKAYWFLGAVVFLTALGFNNEVIKILTSLLGGS